MDLGAQEAGDENGVAPASPSAVRRDEEMDMGRLKDVKSKAKSIRSVGLDMKIIDICETPMIIGNPRNTKKCYYLADKASNQPIRLFITDK